MCADPQEFMAVFTIKPGRRRLRVIFGLTIENTTLSPSRAITIVV